MSLLLRAIPPILGLCAVALVLYRFKQACDQVECMTRPGPLGPDGCCDGD